ncbi:tRNA (5-methylaminomethyl-2-thiouridine)(34)-methyltransferase MnmD [Sporocytophaga myxococcoides]|uniref:tRNA (5-methylaminomethyl-2-thiouridine)(34)-methyltransferase MnmD n=1 Tax=Sporocytophaga myxococcoides TaxID=153721 RepID=UPI0003FDE784|nr:tRNA (5-methylaminomethyl-2-thiouridine)(34)-methyltransferase MnmD [Sporocytophaga myxococcoides]
MQSKIEIIKTEDGSHSLYIPDMKETYHSTHGALRESEYVFIQNGLDLIPTDNEINILEVGFGTGLNTFLTFLESEKRALKIYYQTIEPYPLEENIFLELNYPEMISPDKSSIFYDFHKASFGEIKEINQDFIFKKHLQKLENLEMKPAILDLVYFDAFAPSKQPELWELGNFEKIYGWMKNEGVIVSYCASGQFKRNLKAAGFFVETLPGPPGKKEMTRGRK